ncbi:hypothetical protein Cni_G19334 [Canna indica]|uniref:Uncharacterized protein n=1 Tax=Canna indica TaxID=4628 RepID=A0AAQ3QJM3_9LILI|nr:hypothetical protein Cni_G19334 [Canna indica]
MKNSNASRVSFFLLALVASLSFPSTVSCHYTPDRGTDGSTQTYIIQVKKPVHPMDSESLKIWYKSFIPQSDDNSDRFVHFYSEVFSGFAAKLSKEELKELTKKEDFVGAFPNRVLPLLTTHSPAFLGLKEGQGLWKSANLGKGVIIGVLDSGITPGHPSFDDAGLSAPPAKWKGSCASKSGCNNKLIGAKSFIGNDTPIDPTGHGTHTASTAAGNFVRNLNLSYIGGTASGMAPLAHLAIYQVCTSEGCPHADILAGLDASVKDGVDVLSLSMGGPPGRLLYEDPLAVGAFAAVEKGILVSCAAGNSGPDQSSLSNEAPWLLTVAATTTDRSLRATVTLGNGNKIYGESIDQLPNFPKRSFSLIYADDCRNLLQFDFRGKVVVCEIDIPAATLAGIVKDHGGAALILVNMDIEGNTLIDRECNFPCVMVTHDDGKKLRSYATSSKNLTATISFDGVVLGISPAPTVASFSSRGPSVATPSIIKPDISGPGVNVFAAWASSGTGSNSYSVDSGTSMSTPHLSGIAALIKSVHPDWSAAAIKSAIMTTSDDKDRDGKPIQADGKGAASFYAMGAGHVNPTKAADPGLVYDVPIDDYIAYICTKYGRSAYRIVRDRSVNCSKVEKISESELNYPSIALKKGSTVTRTVTNVGPASSSYKLELDMLENVEVTVSPNTLVFKQANEQKSFKVSATKGIGAGNLKWVSDTHVVRSPIVVSS